MIRHALLALLLAAAPSAGPTPTNRTQAMLASLQAMDARLASVAHRLAVDGVGLCPAAVDRAGFTIHMLRQYDADYRDEAAALFGLGDDPGVLAVVAGGAADRAGLRVGDSIAAIEGRAAPDDVADAETMIEAALADGAVALAIERDGRPMRIEIAGERGCASRFQVDPSDGLKAGADGRYVKLSSALVDFARTDDELALIIAHELSHNILRHRESLDAKGVSRGLFRMFGTNPGRLRATENEADRLALHLMARAGFDIAVAPDFWDRLDREIGFGILADGTHASRRERRAIAEAEIALIEAQRARGEPPTPGFDTAAPPSAAR